MMRRVMTAMLLLAALSGGLWAQASDKQGTLRGFVLDLGTGSTLHGVTIEVKPAGLTVQTDLDGMFSVEIPAGEYSLVARKPGYLDKQITGVKVTAGQEAWQEVPLTPQGGVIQETVEVVATTEKASVEALLSERKGMATLTDSIGRQEMSMIPGGDGADVMQRVTGVSIVDNKYVFVRGLGERYSATQLNGSTLPSTQPDKKVVAMDLFPSSLLENIETEKSYTPDQPGEFAGGLVKVNTLDFPTGPSFKLSYGTDYNSISTFKPFQSYRGGKYDFWGYDDGSRSLPNTIPAEKLIRKTPFSSGFTREQMQQFGQAFANQWTYNTNSDAIPGQKFSVVGGNTWGKFGLVTAFNHGTEYRSRRERRTYYKVSAGNELQPFNDYDFNLGTVSTRTGGTANLAYRLDNNNKILFRNFYSHDSSNESRFFQGPNRDYGQELRDYRLRFSEESIYSGQVSGEHYVPLFGNSLVEWKLTRALSSLDEPDLRESLYEFSATQGEFVFANESQSGFRQFTKLNDKIWDPDVNLTTFFHGGGLIGSLKFGATYRDRKRDFHARRFRFIPLNTQGIDLTQRPEDILTLQNIRPDGFEIREETRNTDAYDAKEINRAVYGMADVSISRWRFIGGARVETDMQRVSTFDPFVPEKNTIATELSNSDVLPALNVVYQLNPQMNLRGSASKTLNRPEFRELAPFDFTDVIGGRSVIGYPGLERATIQNYDVRWEWFPGPVDLISASFFYKRFNHPIERVVEMTAQLRTSFRNADSAKNYGFELDFRRNLGFMTDGLENFSVNLNYTFVDSNVKIPDESLVVLTSLNRALAGQSRHVVNGILEYSIPRFGTVARGLVNFQGARISDVGALGLPDIYEDGYTRLDAVVMQPLGESRKWNLKFSGENLLDQTVKFTQGGLPQRTFHTGRTFGVTLAYSFFD